MSSKQYLKRPTYDDLINAESAIGRTIFGPIPKGHRRECFKHKRNVWIWYESWTNGRGALQDMIIRYEVRPNGVYKRIADQSYQKLDQEELNNFRQATKSYLERVKAQLYY